MITIVRFNNALTAAKFCLPGVISVDRRVELDFTLLKTHRVICYQLIRRQ